ncbi:M43 family zinc metalloprotease [Niastella populi]|uniref:Secretion system C-terminal sorting domain-containing protein n=1 Tax=Niastella populi TaxID=550983 RepID=A0A1V9FJ37_9BACT|nr:M43 family zinc metalloprotease [Niastella populi]OQP58383.1 hypothetical protein A4R26_02675 [Niastella populi]
MFATQIMAQPVCGFDAIHNRQMTTNVQYRKQVIENEAQLQTIIKEQQSRKAANASNARVEGVQAALYTIPVVVHVIHTGEAVGHAYNPSDATITGAISYLNQVYAGTYAGMEPAGADAAGEIQIQFALATRGPNCSATNGIDRVDGNAIAGYPANGIRTAGANPGIDEMLVKNYCRWDPSSYYNIYVVHKIDGVDGTSGQFVAGYAYFPGTNPYVDGTVMLATQFQAGQKTLPHEIGHALNLYHPFQGSGDALSCPANTACGSDGDRVCDTDPVTYNQTGGVVDFTCRTGVNSCTGTSYSIRTERNFMNYTSCYTLFTPGQKTRMQAAMGLSSRSCFATSYGATGSYPVSFSSPSAAGCTPATAGTGLNAIIAGLTSVTINNRTFNSSYTRGDFLSGYTTGYIDGASACGNLIPLELGGTYPISFTVLSQNPEQVRAFIDYNNDGDFDDANEQIFFADNIPNFANFITVSSSFTVPASGIAMNTMLRLRVIEDLSSGFGLNTATPCYAPTYGQIEDYPVFFSSGLLPLGLENFKGEKLNKTIQLNWNTNAESEASQFEIERSNNGSDFTAIGVIAAKNKTTGSQYTYDDNNYSGKVIYYRIKQLAKNGQFKYSGLVTIQNDIDAENAVTIFNNPFREKFDVSITTPRQSKVVVKMLDVTGKLLYTKTLHTTNHSTTTVSPETNAMGAGIYFVQVDIDGNRIVKKVIKN